jgi:gluconolactonase
MKAEERIVATGFAFPEGPSIDRHGVLYVTELARGCVSTVIDGRRSVFAALRGSPNGSAFGADGMLYVCNNGGNWPPTPSSGNKHGGGGGQASIQAVRPDGMFTTLLTAIDGKPLNGPNDICFDDHRGFYFSDPAWAPRTAQGVARAEQSPPGDVCYVARDGRPSRVWGGLLFPNGLHVTPDGKALVVAETGTGRVWWAAIHAPGVLGHREVAIDLGLASGLDGMCFDAEGRLLIAGCGSASVHVLATDLHRLEQTITLSDPAITNLCFGGPDHRTLFITAASEGRVTSIVWPVPGMRLFPDTPRV